MLTIIAGIILGMLAVFVLFFFFTCAIKLLSYDRWYRKRYKKEKEHFEKKGWDVGV